MKVIRISVLILAMCLICLYLSLNLDGTMLAYQIDSVVVTNGLDKVNRASGNPRFWAYPYLDAIEIQHWDPGSTIHIKVYVNKASYESGGSPTWSKSEQVDEEGEGRNLDIPISPQNFIILSSGSDQKELVVQNVKINGIDPVTDRVFGIAPAEKSLWVEIGIESGEHFEMNVTASPMGTWVADFSSDFDVTKDSQSALHLYDDDGDGSSDQSYAIVVPQFPFSHFYDDFTYPRDPYNSVFTEMEANGWLIVGYPPPPPDTEPWGEYIRSNVSIVDDAQYGKLLQLIATTSNTRQSMRHSRIETQKPGKFLDGTYVARVFFTDHDAEYPDAPDVNVQTFYTFNNSPRAEMDFEYLPFNSWGSHTCGGSYEVVPTQEPAMWMNSWSSPDTKDCHTLVFEEDKSLQGWHHLMFQVDSDTEVVRFFIVEDEAGAPNDNLPDKEYSVGGEFFPNTYMNISLAHWIDEPDESRDDTRKYQMKVDWVYYVQGDIFDFDQVYDVVKELRKKEEFFTDTVGIKSSSSILSQSIEMVAGDSYSAQAHVPLQTATVDFRTFWEGSTVETSLVDPNGRLVTSDIAEVDISIDHFKGATMEAYRINCPIPGNWTVQLYGKELPESGEEISIEAIATNGPTYLPLVMQSTKFLPNE